MKTLEERREETMLENPIFLLQINEDQIRECVECHAEVDIDNWKTDRVFLFAEEAVSYATQKGYGAMGRDWRVWAVPAQGKLIRRLQ